MKDLKKFISTTIREYLNEQYIEKPKDIVNNYTHYKSGDKYYPKSEWAKWFLSQDRNSKEQIAYSIKNDKSLRNALLSNWFDYYKNTVNDNINYSNFLNKEITVYRGETSKDIKFGEANGFTSYTPQKDLAKHFSRDGVDKIIELKIKPKDTYGMIDSVGNEIEVLIPTKFSNEFMKRKLDDYSNLNIRVFDELTNDEINKFSELEDNKQYEDAIELLMNYVKKYKQNI
jgi:hypothetical protein